MTDAETKTGMAGWLKVVLIIALVFAVMVVLCCAGGFIFVKSLIKSDTASIRSTAESIMTLKHPLSDDYTYEIAMDMGFAGTRLAAVVHKPEEMHIIASQILTNEKELNPEEVLAKFPQQGRQGRVKLDGKGEKQVAGKKMTFVTGKSRKAGQETPIFLGTITMNEPKPHFFVVVATLDKPGALNQEALDGFLDDIDTVK